MHELHRNRARRAPPSPLIREAVEFLRGDALVLEPRVRWPAPALEVLHASFPEAVSVTDSGRFKVTIPEPLRVQSGRTLCIWGDAGWGSEVAKGKYEIGCFSDELVEAAARLVPEKWKPQPLPGWIAAVPSNRRPTLMHSFAERLAQRLGVPFAHVLRKVRETAPQKEMQNSVQQLRNLIGAFAVQGPVPSEPVLLVDDVIDSGWTLCLLGAILQQHGSGPVFPFTLAKASPRGS